MDFDHSTDTITADVATDPLRIGGTAGLVVPIGTTSQRPTGENALIRYNSDTSSLETAIGSANWVPIGDTAIVNVNSTWKFDTSTTNSDPGTKTFRLNNATLASVTAIYISETSNTGVDASTAFSFMTTGDKIYIQQKDTASKAAIFTVSGAIVDNGAWRTIPVTVSQSATIYDNNAQCGVNILFGTSGGGSGTVTSVSVTTANGVSGTVATATTTPAISLTLGDITPSSNSIGNLAYSPTAGTCKLSYADTVNNYINPIIQNKSTGTAASSDLSLNTNTGTDSIEYVNLGINCSGWTGNTFGLAKDGYLVNEGGASGVGNLMVGTSQPNTKIKFSVGNGFLNSTAGILELTSSIATVNGNASVTGNLTLGTATNSITSSSGVNLSINSGSALSSTASGTTLSMSGGAGGSTSGNGGNVVISAGSPVDGNGGNVTFNGGNGVGTNRDAGSIIFNGGTPTGTGGAGDIQFITRGIPRLRIGGQGGWNINANNDPGVRGAAITSYGPATPTLWKRQMPHYDANIDFGFVGDLKQPFVVGVGYDGAMTSGSNVLTCATTAPFVAADVGKRITVTGAGANSAMLVGTITGFTSASQVTLSVSAGTTVSAKCVRYGTDNTAAIAAMVSAINSSTYNYVEIFFPQSETNAYGFPTAVTFNKQTIIKGIGSTSTTDCGDYMKSGGTCLSWWGTSSTTGTDTFGAFWNIEPAIGINNTPITGDAFQDCWIDCRNGDQNQALKGVRVNSNSAFVWDNVFIMDALAVAVDFGVVAPGTATPNAGSLGMAKDSTRGSMNNLRVRMLDHTVAPVAPTLTPTTTSTAITLSTTPQNLTLAAANGLTPSGYVWVQTAVGYPVLVKYTGGGGTTTLTGCTVSALAAVYQPTTVNGSNVVQCSPGNGAAFRFSGDQGANTCCNNMSMWQISHGTTWGPAAILLQNSDSNQFSQVVINGGNATNGGAINRIRKPGVFFCGSAVAANLASRNNLFLGGSAGAGGVVVNGVNNAGAILTGPATANYWYEYQLGNGEPKPVNEAVAATATQGPVGPRLYYSANGGMPEGAVSNVKVADQAPAASTLTHILGSLVSIPPQGLQVGTMVRWRMIMSKTAAGLVSNSFNIRLGTGGNTSDAALSTFTTGTGTAVADTAEVVIEFVVRTTGASATGHGSFRMSHNLSTTGWTNVPTNVIQGATATFNSTNQGQYLSLSCTMGAGMVATIHSCVAECVNVSN